MTEAGILAPIRKYLDLLTNQRLLMYRRIHVMPIIRGWRGKVPILSKNTDMIGFPDLWVLANGRSGFIETKARGGTLSKEQRAFRDEAIQNGSKYSASMSLTEAITFLREEMGVDDGWNRKR